MATRLTISDLEIERKDGFELQLGDDVFTFADPKSIQARNLIAFESMTSADALGAVLGAEKAEAFLNHPDVDGYVLEAVLTRYMAHYGLGSPPEGKGSRPSSRGSASTSKRTSPRKGTR